MNIQFKNLAELLGSVLDGNIGFSAQSSASQLINSVCEVNSLGLNLLDLQGCCSAEDVSEELKEVLDGYDWFTVLSFQFDIEEITSYLIESTNLRLRYSHSDIQGFVEEHLSEWSDNARRYIDQL